MQERTPSALGVKHEESSFQPVDAEPSVEIPARPLQSIHSRQPTEERPNLMSRGSTIQSGQDEEAVVYSQSRMLQDPTGRLRKLPLGRICTNLVPPPTAN